MAFTLMLNSLSKLSGDAVRKGSSTAAAALLIRKERMKLNIFTVDAFAHKPFAGNPAAVVPLTQTLQDSALQDIARELNLSETAYVIPVNGSAITDENCSWAESCRFSLRWFTPTNEVPLCGHATLATAHVLFRHLGNTNNQIEFETKSGVLLARRSGEKIVLDFPKNPPCELHPTLKADLAGLVKAAVRDDLPVKELKISHETKKLLIRLADSCTRKDLESLRPDTGLLMSLHDGTVIKGVMVTLRGRLPLEEEVEEKVINDEEQDSKQYHVLSRYFAPWNGIPEDPVTGGAHTVLGPYWSEELGITTLKCEQCSPRGGDLEVTIRSDGRVDLAGRATTVIQGSINI
ncbi:phenazine biosynthesis-like domain-containing protein 1 isoform X2 [Macrobrachium rosenbergii]|uniref:phenazine biosynthesis-like domain-containing protein 1 isoform X2 n=1 Tax=Macrobrachium rosenbergii TaxID=79674 RepID=UPI0034D4AE73